MYRYIIMAAITTFVNIKPLVKFKLSALLSCAIEYHLAHKGSKNILFYLILWIIKATSISLNTLNLLSYTAQ